MNTQTYNLLKTGLILIALAVIPGCNTSEQNTEYKQSSSEFSAVKLTWQQRSSKEVAKRVSVLARLIGVDTSDKHLAKVLSDRDSLGNWQPLLDEKSDLIFKVLPAYDELRIVNPSLAESIEGLKLEKLEAVKIATDVLQALNNNDVLNGLRYQPDKYKVGYHRVGFGSTDSKQSEEIIVGYRITFLAHIDNIPLANAGVRIAVHRSGKLSGIRIGGVSASKGTGKKQERQVSDDEIKKRFKASIPKGMKPRIAWQRLMYVMPDDERSAVVYPTNTISYSLVGESEQGEVISRRKTVGFSVVDKDAGMIDYLKPSAKHQTVKLNRDAKQDGSLNKKVKEADEHPNQIGSELYN